ncbi:phd_YefM [bacterium BMS3Abin15]|nr:phd_YefM [bacterium BMS3Abin15]
MKATAKDLRFHSRELLDTVNRGEEVIITYRGRPCAKLVPLEQDSKNKKENKENELFGIWKDNPDVKDVEKYVRKLRKGRFKDAC